MRHSENRDSGGGANATVRAQKVPELPSQIVMAALLW